MVVATLQGAAAASRRLPRRSEGLARGVRVVDALEDKDDVGVVDVEREDDGEAGKIDGVWSSPDARVLGARALASPRREKDIELCCVGQCGQRRRHDEQECDDGTERSL